MDIVAFVDMQDTEALHILGVELVAGMEDILAGAALVVIVDTEGIEELAHTLDIEVIVDIEDIVVDIAEIVPKVAAGADFAGEDAVVQVFVAVGHAVAVGHLPVPVSLLYEQHPTKALF